MLKFDGNVPAGRAVARESELENLKGKWMGLDKFPSQRLLSSNTCSAKSFLLPTHLNEK